MRLLLDTQLLLSAKAEPARLSKKARVLLEDPDNDLCFSVASLWEISIKHALNKSDFVVDPCLLRRKLVQDAYAEFNVEADHTTATLALPALHKDPFDRLLVAQATVEGLTLLTNDRLVARYPGQIMKV